MLRFEPKNPDYRAAATGVFDGQPAMRTLGISIAALDAGEAELSMPYSASLAQHSGFIHAGIITTALDTACGMAAFTLRPPQSGILTVEFKTNLLNPAKGERFRFRASVVKPGRTPTVCEAKAFAIQDGIETLVAAMAGTLMALPQRDPAAT
jgi:uncharacterized protein (TIGR00369 family)